ncbi:Aste57867_2516 [Aphanomyces stellatus]|uniref:Aste57867_2516 protein n=1 Tax=Aphanomyces stellatus TaxID=120398 RepID=A0A485K7T7_9STRA|nr:hypothetical protein As57867_002509 [Aphanomyces stellatus]VFT79715.1 Aste57867_2516 [Aphanomyces stellatus]
MTTKPLFSPIQVGTLTLPNRIFMAPLTRVRAGRAHLPNALMVEHYAQRASAGLIIAECTMITANSSAFINEPGIYTLEQQLAWKDVTDAVHAKGGKIFLQIWHAGRAIHPDNNDGTPTIAPSAIAIDGDIKTIHGRVPHVTPRALEADEIPGIIALYAAAAKHAVDISGFDGVEIHGANGYLVDQFLKSSSNHRTDGYGGSLANRTRFLRELVAAVVAAVGADKVGIRFSPLSNSMRDEDPFGLSQALAKICQDANLAYVHVIRGDFAKVQQGDVLSIFRQHFKNTLISNLAYTKDEANDAIAKGLVDAIAFGVPFIANPDLVDRFAANAKLNDANPATFYGDDAVGYNDYPTLKEMESLP